MSGSVLVLCIRMCILSICNGMTDGHLVIHGVMSFEAKDGYRALLKERVCQFRPMNYYGKDVFK